MNDKNNKDPYNFEKTADFIREYNEKTNGENQPGGKIYMKGSRGKGKWSGKSDGAK